MFIIDNLLTVKDVQDRLGIGRNNAYKLINKKGFPKITVGKKILIPESEFEKYMMAHLRQTINLE